MVGIARSLASQFLIVTCSGAVKASAGDVDGNAGNRPHDEYTRAARARQPVGRYHCPATHRQETRP
jgi:hypothetical protein